MSVERTRGEAPPAAVRARLVTEPGLAAQLAGSLDRGPEALAAGSSTTVGGLSVTATVSNNCTISTAALAFGAYDPIVTHASTALV